MLHIHYTNEIIIICTIIAQVNNRILFEGVLKIYWGVKNAIILAPGAAYAKQRHNRQSIYDFVGVDDGAYLMMLEEASKARMRRELQDGEKKRLREITENSLLLQVSIITSPTIHSHTSRTVHVYFEPLIWYCMNSRVNSGRSCI